MGGAKQKKPGPETVLVGTETVLVGTETVLVGTLMTSGGVDGRSAHSVGHHVVCPAAGSVVTCQLPSLFSARLRGDARLIRGQMAGASDSVLLFPEAIDMKTF